MAIQSRAPDLPTVLLTRPAVQSARFSALLETEFPGQLLCLASPLMAPDWVPDALPRQDWTAILLTSETGAEAALRRRAVEHLPELAFCVGKRTAEVAAAAFTTEVAEGDAEALLALVLRSGLGGPMLHLRGRDARGDLAARLTAAGVETAEVVVYDQRAQSLNLAATDHLLGKAPVIVPLFSPRSATLFRAEAGRVAAIAPLHLAALSPAVAEVLAPLPRAALAVATHPDARSMVTTIRLLLGNLRRS